MIINLITIKDVLAAPNHGEVVHSRCKNCFSKGPVVNNHLNRVKEHLEANKPLLNCPYCGAVTKVELNDVLEITNFLHQRVISVP